MNGHIIKLNKPCCYVISPKDRVFYNSSRTHESITMAFVFFIVYRWCVCFHYIMVEK
jgi:hypothetical protein